MNFFQFLCYTIWLQSFFVIRFSQTNESETSLVLTKRNGEFKLKKPDRYVPETNTAYFKTPRNGKTYHFCQTSLEWKGEKYSYLHKTKKMQPKEEFNDSYECNTPAKPNLVREFNPKELKNVVWNDREMELLYSGYMLKTDRNITTKAQKLVPFVKTKPQYLVPNSGFEFLVMLEIYSNMVIDQTVAVEYVLLSTNIPYHETISTDNVVALTEYRDKELNIFQCTSGATDYTKCFEGVISNDGMKTLRETATDNNLSIILLAPTQHFHIPMWRNPCLTSDNIFPMWEKPKSMWKRVDTFARIVSKHLGDLKVTVGVTGTMTLSGVKVKDKYGYKLPQYLWKIFEYPQNDPTRGIIVVLNYNCFENTETKICQEKISCKTNGWLIGNDDYLTGQIYCCAMTADNIEKLEAPYLPLTKKKGFHLNYLTDKVKIIQQEYESEIDRQDGVN